MSPVTRTIHVVGGASRAGRSGAADLAPASEFLARCPIRGCERRLGRGGLTARHLAEHYVQDDGDAIVAALLRLWREHARAIVARGEITNGGAGGAR